MKKRIFAALALLLAAAFLLTAAAYDNVYIYDGADLLNADEENALTAHFDGIYADSGLLCVFVTAENDTGVLDRLPEYAGAATDMLLLHVDMGIREYNLYQYNGIEGESAFRVSSAESDDILDSLADYARSGDWYGAAICFSDEAEAAFRNADNFVSGVDKYGDEGYTEYPKVKYDAAAVFQLFLRQIGTALPFGLIAALIAVICVLVSYKKKTRGEVYPLDAYTNLKLTDSQDNFLTKNVVVTVIHENTSSSGGGGGSRGGGGGGGHMGGRSF